MDFKQIAQEVIENVGGKENVSSATHCITRLRLILKDNSLYNRQAIENIKGAKGVIFNSGQLQIIFGSGTVEKVYAEFARLTGAKEVSVSEMKNEGISKQGKLQQGFKVFSDIFIPIIPAFIGAAMILGIRSILTTQGLFGMEGSLADKSTTIADLAKFLKIIATTFDYLPVLVMYSATKRFGGNPILGLLVGFVMIHPGLADRNQYVLGTVKPEYWHLFGLAIPAVAFQGGVFPWFLSKVEKITDKYAPQVLAYILVPTITILFSNLALFTIFGPLGNAIGTGLGAVIDLLYNKGGAFGAFVFAASLQPLVVTGTQHAIQGIEANLVAVTGFNYIQPIWSVSIIAQGGGAIGMYLLYKKKSKDREIAMSSFIPSLVGITEPGFGGVIMKIFDVKAIGQGLTVLPGLTIVTPQTLIPYIVGNLVAFTLPIVFLFIYDKVKGVPKGYEDVSKKNSKAI